MESNKNKLTKGIIYSTVIISALPYLFMLAGADFGWQRTPLNADEFGRMSGAEQLDSVVSSLIGAFLHLILEWSAVVIAMATAILAFVQYRITGNSATAIIGIALLCAGFMDAFHALSASKIIHSVADNSNFIPFSWALSRVFKALILFAGVGIFLLGLDKQKSKRTKDSFVLSTSLIFLAVSYLLIRICAVSTNLPETQFPDQLITRPYDVFPLTLFVVLAAWAIPKFRKKEKSIFSHALLWSMVPAIATQLHMAFGSSELFDAHFNAGHFLKTVSYIVPFIGITIDYFTTYKEQRLQLLEIKKAHHSLENKNRELSQIAYVTSHDLQEPLRTLMSMCDIFDQQYRDKLDPEAQQLLKYIMQSSQRMSALVRDLMVYNYIGKDKDLSMVDCNLLLKSIQEDLDSKIKEHKASITVTELPKVHAHETELRLLFQNLISNAIKFRKKDQKPEILISYQEKRGKWLFSVADNGIGIAEKHQEKIFRIFQRLHNKKEYEGTGVGLAHCKKIIDQHGGEIWVESAENAGSTFHFTIPK